MSIAESTSIALLNRLKSPDADMAWQRFVDLYGPLIFYWGRQRGLPRKKSVANQASTRTAGTGRVGVISPAAVAAARNQKFFEDFETDSQVSFVELTEPKQQPGYRFRPAISDQSAGKPVFHLSPASKRRFTVPPRQSNLGVEIPCPR